MLAPKLAKDVQYLIDRTALLAAGVELAVRIGAGAAFTKAIIRFAVHSVLAADQGDVFLSFTYILPAFDHDRTQAKLDQAKGGKQTSRTCSHHDNRLTGRDVFIFDRLIFRFVRHLVDEGTQFHIHIDRPLTRIDRTFQYPDSLDMRDRHARFTGDDLFQRLFAGCLFGQYAEL